MLWILPKMLEIQHKILNFLNESTQIIFIAWCLELYWIVIEVLLQSSIAEVCYSEK